MNVFSSLTEPSSGPTAPPDVDAPPPYEPLPRTPGEAAPALPFLGSQISQASTTSAAGTHGGYAPSGVKLGYMDFVPMIVNRRVFNNDEYETFE